MRGLLLLGVVGATLYGLLLLTDYALAPGETKTAAAVKAEANSHDRTLKSWGRTLPALEITPRSNDQPHWRANTDQFDVSSKKLVEAKNEILELESLEKAKDQELSKPTPAKLGSRWSVKPGPQVANDFAEKREVRRGRWARRDERRRRVGLFGRRFATFANVP